MVTVSEYLIMGNKIQGLQEVFYLISNKCYPNYL